MIKNLINTLAKSILIPLGLTAATSAADAGIDKKNLDSRTTTLIISKDRIIIKIFKSIEVSGLLLKGVSETIQNEVFNSNNDSIHRTKRKIS